MNERSDIEEKCETKKIDDQKERYHATVHKKKSKRKIVAVNTPVRKAPSSHT